MIMTMIIMIMMVGAHLHLVVDAQRRIIVLAALVDVRVLGGARRRRPGALPILLL